ncbi:serine/threonine protein kinase [Coccidioides immitis RS]|uniref:mitogen-activated protein kinase kinase n=2 Tax=Coccidioides immitis TaxID=5501 RepID=J3K0R3_COCIM|nr:serine/threonine protein kinase [Coccidioides immitis RS]EAS27459.3 serine/threonine protein kinase [Coccidioides immitis RS]
MMNEQQHIFNNASPSKHWIPDPPDMAWADVVAAIDPRALSFSMNSQIYKFKQGRKAYKAPASQREFDLMMAAGDCAVKVHGRSLWRDKEGEIRMSGIIMDLETPFDPKSVEDPQRKGLMGQIISVLHKLHRKGIIHGDIKPANFLLCTDGWLRLCDFSDAMRVGEEPSSWGGLTTTNYISPRRTRNWPDGTDPPPTIEDDLYGLGLSLWELYTRRTPFEGWYEDEHHVDSSQREDG